MSNKQQEDKKMPKARLQ